MSNLQEAIDKVNQTTKRNHIFFLTNDAERALGLEKLLDNYHIVCIDNNYLQQQLKRIGIKTFCLEENINIQNPLFRNSYKLLAQQQVQEYIHNNSPETPNLVFFKIASNIEFLAKNLKFNILNTSSQLNKLFENKISQWELLKDIPIRTPKIIISLFRDLEYESIKKKFGNFVIQFDRGQSGSSTYFIESEEDFRKLQEIFPHIKVKVAEEITGIYFTINACVTKYGVAVGGLSNQITGIPNLTSYKGGTCGNDWNQINITEEARKEILDFTTKIGQAMKEKGYKGLFGVDYVMDNNGLVYMLEVNARCPASIPMYTQYQIINNQFPLNLMHILEFLNLEYKLDIKEENERNILPFNYSQIIFKNLYEEIARVDEIVEGGLYTSNLTKETDNYEIKDIKEEGMLLLTAKSGRTVNSNIEYLRIQMHSASLDNNLKLNREKEDLVNELLSDIKLSIV